MGVSHRRLDSPVAAGAPPSSRRRDRCRSDVGREVARPEARGKAERRALLFFPWELKAATNDFFLLSQFYLFNHTHKHMYMAKTRHNFRYNHQPRTKQSKAYLHGSDTVGGSSAQRHGREIHSIFFFRTQQDKTIVQHIYIAETRALDFALQDKTKVAECIVCVRSYSLMDKPKHCGPAFRRGRF